MPSTDYMGWEGHLRRCPPGDFLLQRLVAELIIVLEHFMAGFADKKAKAKPRTLKQIAPWLTYGAPKHTPQQAKNRFAAALEIAHQEDD